MTSRLSRFSTIRALALAWAVVGCGADAAEDETTDGSSSVGESSTSTETTGSPGSGGEPTESSAGPAGSADESSGGIAQDSSGESTTGDAPWTDPTLSQDPADHARSAPYQEVIWDRREDLRYQIEAQFGELRFTDEEAQGLTYSSGWGLAAYHTMDELIALSQLLETTRDDAVRSNYAALARDMLDIVVPAIEEGRGTEACAPPGSLYQCSPGNFRYLDAGHGTGAAGFVMNALWENPTLREQYASELEGWATTLQPILERHFAITEPTEASDFPHMPAKIAAGHLAIGKILDDVRYLDAFERVVQVLAASARTNAIEGWVGSDVSHARVSAAVMHLAFREQLRGTLPNILTAEDLAGVGNAFAEALLAHQAVGGFDGSVVGHHGVFVRFSSEIDERVDASYGPMLDDANPGSHAWARPLETSAGLAIGHVTRIE